MRTAAKSTRAAQTQHVIDTMWVTMYLIFPEKLITKELLPTMPKTKEKIFKAKTGVWSGTLLWVCPLTRQCSTSPTKEIKLANGATQADINGRYDEIRSHNTKCRSPGWTERLVIVNIGARSTRFNTAAARGMKTSSVSFSFMPWSG